MSALLRKNMVAASSRSPKYGCESSNRLLWVRTIRQDWSDRGFLEVFENVLSNVLLEHRGL